MLNATYSAEGPLCGEEVGSVIYFTSFAGTIARVRMGAVTRASKNHFREGRR